MIPSCPNGGGSGGGGGNEQKWRRPSTVDRSTGGRRPVDERAEADPREKVERRKGKGKVRDFGAEVRI